MAKWKAEQHSSTSSITQLHVVCVSSSPAAFAAPASRNQAHESKILTLAEKTLTPLATLSGVMVTWEPHLLPSQLHPTQHGCAKSLLTGNILLDRGWLNRPLFGREWAGNIKTQGYTFLLAVKILPYFILVKQLLTRHTLELQSCHIQVGARRRRRFHKSL